MTFCVKFEIQFTGHKNILSNHKKTIEITKDINLTPRGDCIVGVGAKHACADIPDEIKKKLCNSNQIVRLTITSDNYKFEIIGHGHEKITLTHTDDIVIRKSRFVCSRTLAVGCDKASNDMPREMIKHLQDPNTRGVFSIQV